MWGLPFESDLMILTLFQGHRGVGNINDRLCFLILVHSSLDVVWLLHMCDSDVYYTEWKSPEHIHFRFLLVLQSAFLSSYVKYHFPVPS